MVRIIIKITTQLPIDTPARVTWATVDLHSTELSDLLMRAKVDELFSAEIVGGELLDVQASK